MHKHNFIFTYDGKAICENPSCTYSLSLRQIKEILYDFANGEAAQQSMRSEETVGHPIADAMQDLVRYIESDEA
jgi:hypothetical protein